MQVKDVMNPDPVVLKREDPVTKAIRVFLDSGVSLIPILDDEDNFIGIVTMKDILWSFLPLLEEESNEEGSILNHYPTIYLIDDVMEWDASTIQEDDDLISSIGKMEAENLVCITVLRGQRVVGILNNINLFRAIFSKK